MDDVILKEAKKVIDIEIESLTLIKSNLNGDFVKAVKLLSESNKIIVSGVGKSGIIARKIAATFASIGIPSFFMHPGDSLHGDIGMVSKGDTIILLSKSGSTEELITMMPYLKNRGANTIAITGNLNSYLAISSDLRINAYIENEACPLNIAPMSSALVSLAIGDALAACVMSRKEVTVEEFSRQHPLGQIGRNITLHVKDVMHTGNTLPLIDKYSSFREALLEMTKKSLGCVCIVENSKLMGIITDGDVRRTLQKNDEIKDLKAVDLMTSHPVTTNGEMLLGEALSIMESRESQISVLPVIDGNNNLCGVIRLHDIVMSGI